MFVVVGIVVVGMAVVGVAVVDSDLAVVDCSFDDFDVDLIPKVDCTDFSDDYSFYVVPGFFCAVLGFLVEVCWSFRK